MGRMILKERVFTPTGRSLGSFSAVDLEPFDLQYTESDAPSQEEGQQGGGGRKRVPDPVDNDPLKPITSPDSSNNKSGVDPFKQNNPGEDGDGSPPDKWDLEGNDLDDEEQMGPPPEPPAESLGGGGQGDGEAPDSDEDWGSGGPEDNTPQRGQDNGGQQDGQQSGEGGGSEGQPGEDGGDPSGQGSLSSGGQSDQLGQQGGDQSGSDSGDGSSDSGEQDGSSGSQSSDQGGQSENPGQSGNQSGDPSGGQPGSSGGSSGQGSSSQSGGQSGPGGSSSSEDGYSENRETISKMLGDDQEEDDDSSSDLADALKRMDSERSEAAKAKEAIDQEIAKEDKEKRKNPVSKEEAQAAKDIVSDAVRRSKEEKARRAEQGTNARRSSADNEFAEGYDDLEDAVLGALGAGAMTTLFNPAMKSDWRVQLDKVFDQATGMEIITNPNLINKKIENAPPGREDDVPAIDKILILLDCSGSMGYEAFKQVVSHVDTMLKVRKMNNTTFHIICWGDGNVKAVCDTHMKVKGRVFKKTMMGLHAKNWGTAIGPAFKAASQLVKQPDAVLVFTDMGIGDPYSKDDPIVSKYMKKNKKKIIYILTHDASMRLLKDFDSYAYNKKQWIKFKNDRS